MTGRVFDKDGSPIVGVQVYCQGGRLDEAATDRRGNFRLKSLRRGPLRLELRWNDDQRGWARVPAEAVEVDLIFPRQGL